jgi:hypothetical protein
MAMECQAMAMLAVDLKERVREERASEAQKTPIAR